jgi:hypothetical protein
MKVLKSILAVLMICAFASISAFAAAKDKVKTENVTFANDVTVNGTVLKAGDYQIQFNESTGELAVMKNGKLRVKTTAHVQSRSDKAKNTSVRTLDKGSMAELISVTFGGSSQDVVIGAGGGAVTGN